MKKSLAKKIVNRVMEIIGESLDNNDHLDTPSKGTMEIKVYAMMRTGMEMSIPTKDVEHAVECYRRSELN